MNESLKRVRKASRVTWICFAVNILLIVCKLFAGIVGKSGAMIADAIHSISDLGTDIAILLGFRMVKKPPDNTHNYGHGKFETLSSTIVGAILLSVGMGILWAGGTKMIKFFQGMPLEQPGWIAFYAAIFSVLAKELLYHYSIRVGKAINSQAIIANAWHQRSDSLSSIGVMFGIGGAILLGENWRVLDPAAAIAVGLLVIKVGVEIVIKSFKELMEASVNDEMRNNIITIVKKVGGVKNPHGLKTRMLGNNIAIDIHIEVPGTLKVADGHDIASNVEKTLKKTYGDEIFVSVHVEPEKLKSVANQGD